MQNHNYGEAVLYIVQIYSQYKHGCHYLFHVAWYIAGYKVSNASTSMSLESIKSMITVDSCLQRVCLDHYNSGVMMFLVQIMEWAVASSEYSAHIKQIPARLIFG